MADRRIDLSAPNYTIKEVELTADNKFISTHSKDGKLTIKGTDSVVVKLLRIERQIPRGRYECIPSAKEISLIIGQDGTVNFDVPVDFDKEIKKLNDDKLLDLMTKITSELLKRKSENTVCAVPASPLTRINTRGPLGF